MKLVVGDPLGYGSLFEVRAATLAEAPVVVKRCRSQLDARRPAHLFERWELENPTRVMNGTRILESPSPDVLASLLLAEAQVVERVGEAWNHRVLGVGLLASGGVGRASSIELVAPHAFPRSEVDPARLCLVMPLYPGSSLDGFPIEEQRRLLPGFFPALWDALSAWPHGDLQRSSLLVAPDESSFRLLDPGVRLELPTGGTGYNSLSVYSTRLDAYPFEEPVHAPAPAAASGGGRPSPPDLTAAGLAYAEVFLPPSMSLCRILPPWEERYFNLDLEASGRNVWAGLPRPRELARQAGFLKEAFDRWASRAQPPPSAEERALCFALLDGDLEDRSRLVELVDAVQRR